MSHAVQRKAFLVFSGGNDRAVLAFLRALESCGARAHVVARTSSDRILRTRFRADVCHIRPCDRLDLDVFERCVGEARKVAGDATLMVLPSTEYFNEFLLRERASVEALGCQVPLVDRGTYECLTGKRNASDVFGAAGVDVPRTFDTIHAGALPVVAKPVRNISPDGRSLYPHLLLDPARLSAFLSSERGDEFFFQEYVRGESLYLLFYLPRDDGRPAVLASQRNLMQQASGKSMLLAEPAAFHSTPAADRLVSVLRSTGFHGLGMIEVIRCGDRFVFIEMNPRIWGPLQLSVDRGWGLERSFIGDVLHDDPGRYLPASPGPQRMYCWSGGMLETWALGQSPAWHTEPWSLPRIVGCALRNDVYLRRDSWRCFLSEVAQAVRTKHLHERT